MPERKEPLPREEKRGGYSGSTDADKMRPPANLPSGSVQPSTSTDTGDASSEDR
jgi:hypothetical protein